MSTEFTPDSLIIQTGDQGVTFDLSLEAGEVDFLAYFILKEGKKVGAYYADVKKL